MAGKIPFWQTLRRTGLILWVRLLLMACWVKEEKKGRQGRNRHIDHTCKYCFNSADADSVSGAWRWQHLLQLTNSGKQSGRRHTEKHLITNTGSQWREEGGGDRHLSICDITNEKKAFFWHQRWSISVHQLPAHMTHSRWCNHIRNYQERVLLHHSGRTKAHDWERIK